MDMDAELEAIVRRDARARVDAMVRALEGAPAREVCDELWRDAHSLVGLVGMLGEPDLEAASRDLACLLRDEYGRRVELTPADDEEVRRDVARLDAALARSDHQP